MTQQLSLFQDEKPWELYGLTPIAEYCQNHGKVFGSADDLFVTCGVVYERLSGQIDRRIMPLPLDVMAIPVEGLAGCPDGWYVASVETVCRLRRRMESYESQRRRAAEVEFKMSCQKNPEYEEWLGAV